MSAEQRDIYCPRRCVARAYCEDRSAYEQARGCWLGPSWEQHRCNWPSSGNDKPCDCCLPPDTCEGPTRSSCSGSGGGPCLRSMCRTTSSARLHRRQYCSAPNCRTFVSRQHLQQHPLHQQDNSTCLHMCLRIVFALWECVLATAQQPKDVIKLFLQKFHELICIRLLTACPSARRWMRPAVLRSRSECGAGLSQYNCLGTCSDAKAGQPARCP